MLERTHTMQNAGSTVAVIAIVHAVCVSAGVCAHTACTFKSVCMCMKITHINTGEIYNKWFNFLFNINFKGLVHPNSLQLICCWLCRACDLRQTKANYQ